MEEPLGSQSLSAASHNRRKFRVVVTAGFIAACRSAAIQPAPQPPSPAVPEASPIESTDLYRRSGFIVGDGAVPFVGSARFFGSEMADSTLTLLALSIPPRALSFIRAGDRYAAYYSVKIDIVSGQTLVRSERPTGEVRVVGLQETARGDEGVIFQRQLRLAPGAYSLRITVQDSLGANSGVSTTPITVPKLTNGAIASILPVYAVDPRSTRAAPIVAVANPRSTVRYGRDTVIQFYLEAYGPSAPDTVILTSRPGLNPAATLRRDTVLFRSDREPRVAKVSIPIARLGLGNVEFTATRTNTTQLGRVTGFVSIGEDVPMTTMNELIDALKYFATDADLKMLGEATPERRQTLWATLMRQTDPNPGTPQNEALHEHLRRLAVANAQYREDARPGWTTDRGAVVAALGEPDAVSDPVSADSVGTTRLIAWEYRRYRLSLVFSDQGGTGKWKLTPPSDAEFRGFLAVAGPCVGCR